ncbi:hypothetical protein MMC18_001405 [Xylographa bjoerkii]|nr:hypothetical protein [Xylographa bjoerkii]
MALALAGAAKLRPEISLSQALVDYETVLTDDQKIQLQASRIELPDSSAVMSLTAEIDRNNSRARSGRCVGPRLTTLLDSVQQFSSVVDTFVSGSQSLIAVVSQFSAAFLQPFETEFSVYQKDLNRAASIVRDEVALASQQAQVQEANSQALERQKASLHRSWGLKLRGDVSKELEEARKRRAKKARERLLDLLSKYDHQRAWRQARKKGVSTWLTLQANYKEWCATPGSALLWITGNLGSGKTVLSANLVEHKVSTFTSEHTVSYFFCSYDETESLMASTIIGCIARQLLEAVVPVTVDISQKIFERACVDIYQTILLLDKYLPNDRKHFVIIDGLDECPEEEVKMVVETLASLLKLRARDVKIYCSSRPDILHRMRLKIKLDYSIMMSSPSVDSAIAQFIENKLKQCIADGSLRLGDPALIITIRDSLLQGAQGMFLWVDFQIQTLCTQHNDDDLLSTLQNLPKDLPETFDRILARLEQQSATNTVYCRKIFNWLAVAKRPLTLGELREAIAIEPCQSSWSLGRMVNDILWTVSCCGSLVTVDEEQHTVRFTHHSVKLHLLSSAKDSSLSKHHISLPEADTEAGEICVTYLNFSEFDKQISRLGHRGVDPMAIARHSLPNPDIMAKLALTYLKNRSGTRAPVQQQLLETAESSGMWHKRLEFMFLEYARSNWLWHTRTLTESSPEIWKLWSRLIENKTGQVALPWTQEELKVPDTEVLRFIVQTDHSVLLTHVTSYERSYDEKQNIGLRILSILGGLGLATLPPSIMQWYHEDSTLRHTIIIRTIIENDVELLEQMLTKWSNPFLDREISESALNNYGYSTEALKVNSWPRLNSRVFVYFTSGWTPLMLAVRLGHTRIVKCLLTNRQESMGPTAEAPSMLPHFRVAGSHDFEDIMLVILASGRLDPNEYDTDGLTPLMYAAASGCCLAFEKLVAEGALVDKVSNEGLTAVDIALVQGHQFINGRLKRKPSTSTLDYYTGLD